MNDFIKNYIQNAEKEFDDIRHSIDIKRKIFGYTDWKDEKSMIEAANEIWRLEKRLDDAVEIHNKILTMLGVA